MHFETYDKDVQVATFSQDKYSQQRDQKMTDKNTNEENMSTEENKTIVRRFFEEGPSKGNLIIADELLSTDFVMHTPLPASPGIEGMNEVITTCRTAFEHLKVTIEDMVAEGNNVTVVSQLMVYIKAVLWVYRLQESQSLLRGSRYSALRTVRLLNCGVKLTFSA